MTTGWSVVGAAGLGWSMGAVQALVLLLGVAGVGEVRDGEVALGAGLGAALLGGVGGALVAVLARRRREDRGGQVPPRLGPDHDDAAGLAVCARESWRTAALVVGTFAPLVLLVVLPGGASRRNPDLGPTPSDQVDGRLVLAVVLVVGAVAVVLGGLRAAGRAEARLLAALADPVETSPDVVRAVLALRPVALTRVGVGGAAACQLVVVGVVLGPVAGVVGGVAAALAQGVALRGSRQEVATLEAARRRLPAPD